MQKERGSERSEGCPFSTTSGLMCLNSDVGGKWPHCSSPLCLPFYTYLHKSKSGWGKLLLLPSVSLLCLSLSIFLFSSLSPSEGAPSSISPLESGAMPNGKADMKLPKTAQKRCTPGALSLSLPLALPLAPLSLSLSFCVYFVFHISKTVFLLSLIVVGRWLPFDSATLFLFLYISIFISLQSFFA